MVNQRKLMAAKRTRRQPDQEAVAGGLGGQAVREERGQVQRDGQLAAQLLELGQQPGRGAGHYDAHLGKAAKVAVCRARARALARTGLLKAQVPPGS